MLRVSFKEMNTLHQLSSSPRCCDKLQPYISPAWWHTFNTDIRFYSTQFDFLTVSFQLENVLHKSTSGFFVVNTGNVLSLILSVQQCTVGVELTAAAPEIPRDDHKLSSRTSYTGEVRLSPCGWKLHGRYWYGKGWFGHRGCQKEEILYIQCPEHYSIQFTKQTHTQL